MAGGHKYRAKKTWVGDTCFDSKGEANRYLHLLQLVQVGVVDNLQLQPCFEIVINDKKVCKVKLDFSYTVKGSDEVFYEDFKGMDTPMSRLKRKLVKAVHGIDVVVTKKINQDDHISLALR